MTINQKVSSLVGYLVIAVAIAVLFGGVFIYQYYAVQVLSTVKIISPVSRSANSITYTNSEFGFRLQLPKTWKGYSVVKSSWTGHVVDDYTKTYTGTIITIKNPQSNAKQQWQDIPIMVINPTLYIRMGDNGDISVGVAPIGPEKIGENARYVFATPPRWYGFTDVIGWEEAVNIVKSFKGF